MGKSKRVSQVVIRVVTAAGAVAFALLGVLAAAGLADPRFAAAAFGVALLAVGADEVAGALVAGWPRGRRGPPAGGRPPLREGRLSSLGWGLSLVSAGSLLIGLDRVPVTARLAAVAVFVAGFALGVVGQSYDRRRAEAARGGPDADPPAAADPARHFGSGTS
jgi:hypothetical protein